MSMAEGFHTSFHQQICSIGGRRKLPRRRPPAQNESAVLWRSLEGQSEFRHSLHHCVLLCGASTTVSKPKVVVCDLSCTLCLELRNVIQCQRGSTHLRHTVMQRLKPNSNNKVTRCVSINEKNNPRRRRPWNRGQSGTLPKRLGLLQLLHLLQVPEPQPPKLRVRLQVLNLCHPLSLNLSLPLPLSLNLRLHLPLSLNLCCLRRSSSASRCLCRLSSASRCLI